MTKYRDLFVLLLLSAVIYGSSFGDFKYYNLDTSDAFSDAKWYVKLAERSTTDNEESGIHNFRWVIPWLAGEISKNEFVVKLARSSSENYPGDKKEIRLSFYIVNFLLVLFASYFLYRLFFRLGLPYSLSLLGSVLFISSRTTAYTVGTPLVDAGYLFSISIFFYVVILNQKKIAVIFFPLLILLKEVILPFLFLGLFFKKNRNTTYYATLVASLALFVFIISSVNMTGVETSHSKLLSSVLLFIDILMNHANNIWANFLGIFSLKGFHNIFHGFTFLIVLSIIGIWQTWKSKKTSSEILIFMLACILLSLLMALLSGNTGRLFFSAYIPVIYFTLITLETIFQQKKN